MNLTALAGKDKHKSAETKNSKDEALIQSLFIEGVQAHILGNSMEALNKFTEVLKRDPRNDPAMYEISRLHYEIGNMDQAISYAQQAIKLNPENEYYYVYLAEAQGEKGDYDDASQTYAGLIKLKPKEYDYYYDWAYMLTKAKKLKEAIDVYNLLEQKTGVEEEIVLQKQPLWIQLNKVDEAVKDIEKLIALSPSETRYYNMIGEIYEANSMYDKAIDTYQRVLKIDGNNADALVAIADIYHKKGNEKMYQEYLEKVFNDTAIDIDAKVMTLIPLIEKLDKDTTLGESVMKMADMILAAHPGNVKAIVTKADVYYSTNRKKEALAEYMKAINITDTVPSSVWIQLYVLCTELEQYDDLITTTKKGIQSNPDDPFGYFYAAVAYQQKKDFTEASHAITSGLDLEKKLKDQKLSFAPQLKLQMLITLGDVSYELKNYTRSDSAYEAALEIDPNNATVLNNYAYYLSERNEDLEKAERMSKKSNLLIDNNSAFLDTYAWIMYKMKNYKEALKWIEQAMELPDAQNRPDLLDHYGDILSKLGQADKATEKWQKALEAGGNKDELAVKIKNKKID
jgi:tetratricopeptide (TPR) repeat protein